MTTIGIIGAMDNEIEKLKVKYHLLKDKDNKEIYINEIGDKRIVVARSGVGKVNSAAMTQYIIDNYKVDAIINSGCAGAINSKLNIMDIVIGESTTYYDFNPIEIMQSHVPDSGVIKSNTILLNTAREILSKMHIDNYYFGMLASGDNFISGEEIKMKILLRTGALAVDMESASIGHVCSLNNIPFLPIRTISDVADGGEYQEEMAAYKSSEFVSLMVSELFNYLDRENFDKNRVYLYVPKIEDLDYYSKLLNDKRTMEYNAGYELNLEGYDKQTGCICSFDKKKWYKRQMTDKNRYFAYIIDKKNNIPVGYLNFHYDQEQFKHSMGIVIEYKHRSNHYATDAMKLLLDIAFNEYKVDYLIDSIPYNRNNALKLFTKFGFVDTKHDFYLNKFNQRERVTILELSRDRYIK